MQKRSKSLRSINQRRRNVYSTGC